MRSKEEPDPPNPPGFAPSHDAQCALEVFEIRQLINFSTTSTSHEVYRLALETNFLKTVGRPTSGRGHVGRGDCHPATDIGSHRSRCPPRGTCDWCRELCVQCAAVQGRDSFFFGEAVHAKENLFFSFLFFSGYAFRFLHLRVTPCIFRGVLGTVLSTVTKTVLFSNCSFIFFPSETMCVLRAYDYEYHTTV